MSGSLRAYAESKCLVLVQLLANKGATGNSFVPENGILSTLLAI